MPATSIEPLDPSPSPQELSAATEHLSHLPKMSPTAGAGTQEYVAINAASVAALLLGFCSILAIINDAMAAFCILGFILALIALDQIRNSNGTQTGRGIAMVGLFFCSSIGSYVAASDTLQTITRRADLRAISGLCVQFGDDMRDRTYDAAYDLFSLRFKSHVSRQAFVAKLKGMQDQLTGQQNNPNALGPIKGAQWSGLASIAVEQETGIVTAQSQILLNFERGDVPDILLISFRKAADTWMIQTLPDMFPSAPGAAGATTPPPVTGR